MNCSSGAAPSSWWCRPPNGRPARGVLLRRPPLRGGHAAGRLILNRTHPTLCALTVERAVDGAEELDGSGDAAGELTAAVLRIHADRAQTAKRGAAAVAIHRRQSARTGGGRALATVRRIDLDALQAIADQITGETG